MKTPRVLVDRSLPSPKERDFAHSIREEHRSLVDALKYPDDDVIGDIRISRFLRCNGGSKRKASKAFKQFLEFRTEGDNRIERLRKVVIGWSPNEFVSWCAGMRNPYLKLAPFCGETDDYDVVFWAWSGGIDAEQLIHNRPEGHTMNADMDFLVCVLEWLMWHLNEQSKKHGAMCYAVKIVDFDGMREKKNPVFMTETRHLMKFMMTQFSGNYCDHDSLFLLLNTPTFFSVIWGVVKLFMSERQRRKVSIVDTPTSNELLRTVLPTSCLPSRFGGTTSPADDIYVATDDKAAFEKLKVINKAWTQW